MKLTKQIKEVIHRVYHKPMCLQSDYFRLNAISVATAASMGFISNINLEGQATNQWRVTEAGINFYMEK